MIPYIYWNDRGDFKTSPRFCAIDVKYGADYITTPNGKTFKNNKNNEYMYLLGKREPNYPVPAIKYIHLAEFKDCVTNETSAMCELYVIPSLNKHWLFGDRLDNVTLYRDTGREFIPVK